MNAKELPHEVAAGLYLRASVVNLAGGLLCFVSHMGVNNPIRKAANLVLMSGLNNYINIKDSSFATAGNMDSFSVEVNENTNRGKDFFDAVRATSEGFEFDDSLKRIYGHTIVESVGILLSAKAMEYANKTSLNSIEKMRATMLFLAFRAYYRIALIEVEGNYS